MNTTSNLSMAPELQVSSWFNTQNPLSLAELRGKVIVIEAFQMLCPGCVSHGLPQAKEIAGTFATQDVVVLGLHSVFEHHDAMQPHALEAFLHEYGIRFPVAVDAPAEPENGPVPRTMQSYGLRGTPSLLVIDRLGQLRINHFGRVSDMRIAHEISRLVFETVDEEKRITIDEQAGFNAACTPEGCIV